MLPFEQFYIQSSVMDSFHKNRDTICKADIYRSLISVYGNDGESILRLLFYLDGHKEKHANTHNVPPVWRELESAASRSEQNFKEVVDKKIKKTRSVENNHKFFTVVRHVYSSMMDQVPKGNLHKFGIFAYEHEQMEMPNVSALPELINFWCITPPVSKTKVLEALSRLNSTSETLNREGLPVDDQVKMKLAVLHSSLSIPNHLDLISLLIKWVKGKINGKLLLEGIMGWLAVAVVGVGGSAVGSLAGPIASSTSGFLATQAAQALYARLAKKLYEVKQRKALKKAYHYFGLDSTVSNGEINSAYKRLSAVKDPRNGGSREDLVELNVYMEIIRLARGGLNVNRNK